MRDIKQSAFCWQEKKALQLIRDNFRKQQLPLAISLYTIITEQASYLWKDTFNIFWIKLIEQSWIWYKSYRDIMNKFIDLKILEYKKWKITKIPLTQEFIYWESNISLLQIGLVQGCTISCTEPCTHLGQSYKELKEEHKEKTSLSSKEDNSESNDVCKGEEYNNESDCSIKSNINNDPTIIDNITHDCNKEKKKKEKDVIQNRDEVFENLWQWYKSVNTKVQDKKAKAKEYFNRYIKTNYDLDLLRFALPKYVEWVRDKQYLVLLRTYLSDKMYLDYEDQFKSEVEKEEIVQMEQVDKKMEAIEVETKFKRNYDTN